MSVAIAVVGIFVKIVWAVCLYMMCRMVLSFASDWHVDCGHRPLHPRVQVFLAVCAALAVVF